MTAQDKALKENTASAPLQIVAPGTCVETGEQATLVLGMYDHLVETIHQYNPSADFAQIDKAFRYADTHHNGQLRKDGSPFITHPLAVAQIIAEELRLDSESIEAALMHDCIEDTSATYAEIAKEFSPAVADLVEGVSKLTRVQYSTMEEQQMENLRKMFMAMSKDIRVVLIKIADRLHNMRTMQYQSPKKQREKALETIAGIDIISENGIIVCESAAESALPELAAPYAKGRDYRYGKIKLTVYHRGGNEETI